MHEPFFCELPFGCEFFFSFRSLSPLLLSLVVHFAILHHFQSTDETMTVCFPDVMFNFSYGVSRRIFFLLNLASLMLSSPSSLC